MSRLRMTASFAALTSARLRSIVSPSGRIPARPMLIRTRQSCGAPLATAIVSPILSAPFDPASISPVTPSARHKTGPSLSRGVRVDIDQPGDHQLAFGIDGFHRLARKIGVDGQDLTLRNRYVSNPIQFPRGIDHAPALNKQVALHGLRRKRRGSRRHAYKLTPIHHGIGYPRHKYSKASGRVCRFTLPSVCPAFRAKTN